MTEEWRYIAGFEGVHQVSSLGRVKALAMRKLRGRFYHNLPDREISVRINERGYGQVNLQHNKISKTFLVHRIVAMAFIDLIPGKDQVNYKNGIKSDNRVENLEWCTSQENITHALVTGLKKKQRGEELSFSKLKESDVLFIRASNLPHKILCKKFGVYTSTIEKVKSRQTWEHV